jgi:hypothetical protein
VTGGIRPILASSCAKAATAEEASFRIDRPIGSRSAVILALDDEAAEIVDRAAQKPWGAARFFHLDDDVDLAAELEDADVAVMVATADADEEGAERIARICFERGIMTAGLILGERSEVAAAVSALRPYARNLMVTSDEEDVAAVLTALRA